jgi:hypothetical protein
MLGKGLAAALSIALTLSLGALPLALVVSLTGCYAKRATRAANKTLERGFDFDSHGPWIVVTAPGSLLLAGGQIAVGSVIPFGKGVDPREPEIKWYHAYAGEMRPGDEVGILCHGDLATWVTGIRPASGGAWRMARHEKWHFPACLEALPGRYEIEVNYFERDHEDDREESVSRQAESTEPTYAIWEARAGQVDRLEVQIGAREPAQGQPPQRHIPRSRALGTTWWELKESEWFVRVVPEGEWQTQEGPLVEQRAAWAAWDTKRR